MEDAAKTIDDCGRKGRFEGGRSSRYQDLADHVGYDWQGIVAVPTRIFALGFGHSILHRPSKMAETDRFTLGYCTGRPWMVVSSVSYYS